MGVKKKRTALTSRMGVRAASRTAANVTASLCKRRCEPKKINFTKYEPSTFDAFVASTILVLYMICHRSMCMFYSTNVIPHRR